MHITHRQYLTLVSVGFLVIGTLSVIFPAWKNELSYAGSIGLIIGVCAIMYNYDISQKARKA